MDPEKKEVLKENLRALPRNYSTWAVGAVSSLAAVWYSLPEEAQNQIITNLVTLFPWLQVWMGPLSAALLVLGARVWPQGPKTPPDSENPDA